ncbi:MAG: hypothetical protein Kow0069_04540 [Promethearchaeota archaeon]
MVSSDEDDRLSAAFRLKRKPKTKHKPAAPLESGPASKKEKLAPLLEKIGVALEKMAKRPVEVVVVDETTRALDDVEAWDDDTLKRAHAEYKLRKKAREFRRLKELLEKDK